jgi:hypothetical protein
MQRADLEIGPGRGVDAFRCRDYCPNGLQVEGRDRTAQAAKCSAAYAMSIHPVQAAAEFSAGNPPSRIRTMWLSSRDQCTERSFAALSSKGGRL